MPLPQEEPKPTISKTLVPVEQQKSEKRPEKSSMGDVKPHLGLTPSKNLKPVIPKPMQGPKPTTLTKAVIPIE